MCDHPYLLAAAAIASVVVLWVVWDVGYWYGYNKGTADGESSVRDRISRFLSS